MSSELFGYFIGVVFIVVQVFVFWGLAKILSVLNDRMLSENDK